MWVTAGRWRRKKCLNSQPRAFETTVSLHKVYLYPNLAIAVGVSGGGEGSRSMFRRTMAWAQLQRGAPTRRHGLFKSLPRCTAQLRLVTTSQLGPSSADVAHLSLNHSRNCPNPSASVKTTSDARKRRRNTNTFQHVITSTTLHNCFTELRPKVHREEQLRFQYCRGISRLRSY